MLRALVKLIKGKPRMRLVAHKDLENQVLIERARRVMDGSAEFSREEIFAETYEPPSCDEVHYLLIVSGTPQTREGRLLKARHMVRCPNCSEPLAFAADAGMYVDLTEEGRQSLEHVFGPITFLPK